MFDGIHMVLITVSIMACFFGCQGKDSDSASLDAAVIGTWTSEVVENTEMGTGKTEITFNVDGKVRVTTLIIDTTFIDDQESMTVEGNYKIEEGRLVSDIMNKGRPIQIWLDEGTLFLKLPDEAPWPYYRKQ